MRRTLTTLLLLAALLNHAIVMAGNGFAYHAGEGLEHAVMHLGKSGHHHHDDGAVHEDHSDDSKQHVQSDGALVEAALPDVVAAPAPLNTRFRVALAPDRGAAEHFTAGPTRPPRLTA